MGEAPVLRIASDVRAASASDDADHAASRTPDESEPASPLGEERTGLR